jgi:hypothetical protein
MSDASPPIKIQFGGGIPTSEQIERLISGWFTSHPHTVADYGGEKIRDGHGAELIEFEKLFADLIFDIMLGPALHGLDFGYRGVWMEKPRRPKNAVRCQCITVLQPTACDYGDCAPKGKVPPDCTELTHHLDNAWGGRQHQFAWQVTDALQKLIA